MKTSLIWATALDAQVRGSLRSSQSSHGSISMEDLLPKKTDPSDQRPAFLKMLFLVKISVAIDLYPFSYATKITSSLAFKQVVEWVGIFCNFSEHPLQIPCSCPSFWKTTQAMHFALLQEELDLVLPVQGAEGTPLKRVTWLPILRQYGTWNSWTPALWLKTVYECLWYPHVHLPMSQWVLREFVRP